MSEGLKKIVSSLNGFSVLAGFEKLAELEVSKKLGECDVVICNPDLIKSKNVFERIRLYRPGLKFLIIDQEKNQQKDFLNPATVEGYIFLCCDTEEVVKALLSVVAGEKFFCNKALDYMIHKKGTANSCNPVNLTDREVEVLKLIAQGNSSKEISEKLYLSFHTITTHRKNICRKLKVNRVSELVAFAHQNKLI